jgi:ABC-type nitrate/sulfonate/bicarbonate transport system substrate-binding protein
MHEQSELTGLAKSPDREHQLLSTIEAEGDEMAHTKQPCRFFKTMMLAAGFLLFLVVIGYSAEPRKLRLAYSTVGPSGTGLWMAKEIGAFEKYGINADLIFISSGPVVVQALIGGDLHGGLAATNAVISAVMAGAPLVAVMSLVNRPYFRLWVQPEIARMDELRGKTLGVSRFGSVTDNLTRILLRKQGLDGPVNVRQMGGTAEMSVAFQRRKLPAPC